jgi:hypothetical protein
MDVSFLTPAAALVGLLVLVPLALVVVTERRAGHVRRRLRLGRPGGRPVAMLLAAAAAVGVLAAATAAQPVVSRSVPVRVVSGAEVYVVVDTSRSMLAAPAPGAPTRYDRAHAAALRLREELAEASVGLASFTDRVLPHLFPSHDRRVFAATLEQTMRPGVPVPRAGTGQRITDLAALAPLATDNFFDPSTRRRLAVVLGDFETVPYDADGAGRGFREEDVRLLLVRFGGTRDRIFGEQTDAGFAPDAGSIHAQERLAEAAGGEAYGEEDLDTVAAAARAVVAGSRETTVGEERRTTPLAPFLAAAAALPLALVLRRRNV